MINKLRKKFVLTALLSIFGLVSLILLTINLINFALIENEADKVIDMIMDDAGPFNNTNTEDTSLDSTSNSISDGFDSTGTDSPEVSKTMRYFTIKFDEESNATVEQLNISVVNGEEAISWAKELLSYKKGWTKKYYRYRIWNKDNDTSTYVTVLDYSRELSPSYRVLNVSIVGEVLGLIITLIALILVSKIFVMPIEKSNRKQKRFINDAAESLRNPITVLDAEVKVLENDGNKEVAEIMQRAVNNLKKLVIGLDSLTLYDSDEIKENVSEFDLSELTKELLSGYANDFNKDNKTLNINITDKIKYIGDKGKIAELLNIAFENAYKYSTSKASIKLSIENERKVIIIENDCNNIPNGDLDSVFERFYRSDDVKKSGIDGMGLSLSIAREIVNLHLGRIRAYGKDGMFILKIEL